MAIGSLGQIALDLVVNHGQFLSAFSEAGLSSRKFRSEVSDSLSGIGDALGSALGQFGDFGAVVGKALEGATNAAANAITSFNRLGGSMATVVGTGAALAAGLLSVEGAAIALAVHTAENAAKFGEMALKTGLSTTALAGLALAGKTVGVEMDSLTRAINLMNANAVKAELQAGNTKNAFNRLGISQKELKADIAAGTETLLFDVLTRLQNVPEPDAGWIVKQIFGRGGLTILPLIEKGIESIKKSMEFAKELKLGDPGLVEAAFRLRETMALIGAETEGASLKLTKELIPALQYVAEQVEKAFKTGSIQQFIDMLSDLIKNTLTLGYALAHIGDIKIVSPEKIGEAAAASVIEERLKAQRAILSVPLPGGLPDVHATEDIKVLDARIAALQKEQDVLKESKDSWGKYVDGLLNFRAHLEKSPFDVPRSGIDWFGSGYKEKRPIDLEPPEKNKRDFVEAKLFDAERAAQKQEDLANAIGHAGAATVEFKAHAQATEEIQQLWDEAVVKGVENTDKFRHAWLTAIPALQLFAEKFQTNKQNIEDDKAFNALDVRLAKEIALLQGQSEATGKVAEQQAAWKAQLEPVADLLSKEEDHLEELRAKYGDTNDQTKTQADHVALLANYYNDLNDQFQKVSDLLPGKAFTEQTNKLKADIDAQDAYNKALFQGGEAAAQIAAEVAKLTAELKLTPEGAQAIGAQLDELRKKKLDTSAGNLVISDNINTNQQVKDLREQIDYIQKMAPAWEAQGIPMAAVQTALDKLTAQYVEFQAKLILADQEAIHLWDEQIIKVGDFGSRTRAVLNEIILDGKNAGAQIAKEILSAYDGLTTQLAKLITGQKTNFRSVFQNLAEQMAKTEIKQGISLIMEKLFGLKEEGKPDGSAGKPYHVVFGAGNKTELGNDTKGLLTGLSDKGGFLGAIGKVGGFIGKIFGLGGGAAGAAGASAPDGTRSNPLFVAIVSANAGGPGAGGTGGGVAGEVKGAAGIAQSLAPLLSVIPVVGPFLSAGLSIGAGVASQAAGAAGGGGGGAGATPDGTQANPFYVYDLNASGSGGGGGGGLLSGLFSSESGPGLSSLFSSSESSGPGGFGGPSGFFSDFLSNSEPFSVPFLAEGGDMMPGHWYVAGEKGAELIVPKTQSTAIPAGKLGGRSTNITQHFHGFKDTDMFRQSQSQIAQHTYRAARQADTRAFHA